MGMVLVEALQRCRNLPRQTRAGQHRPVYRTWVSPLPPPPPPGHGPDRPRPVEQKFLQRLPGELVITEVPGCERANTSPGRPKQPQPSSSLQLP